MTDTGEVTKEKLVSDMKVVIADAEELLKATANAAGEKAAAARARMEDSLRTARVKVAEAQEVMRDRAKQAAQATDDYVHAHPWKAVGFAAAVGVIVGMLIARR
jgi:ElaB/YqjD/DUF883 family membrane-anchored ribosome-binding protein